MGIDYKELTDSELNMLYAKASAELTRRKDLRELPEQVVGLVGAYEQLGGDKQEIIDRINEPPREVVEPELTQE